MINCENLQREIERILKLIHDKRVSKLRKLSLTTLLNKNPYLYRAIGVQSPEELIENLIEAWISSSDETIFGNEFFEPLALWAAKEANEHGQESRTAKFSEAAGVDISIETEKALYAISVKSGKNIFNSQSSKGQTSEIEQLRARIKKNGKQFLPYIGYGYGRKSKPKKSSDTEKVAGQTFWTLLTGENDFYKKICDAMGQYPISLAKEFDSEFIAKKSTLVEQFNYNFPSSEGKISWDALVAFNSSTEKPKRLKKIPAKESKKKGKA
jgi:hypothetical protein